MLSLSDEDTPAPGAMLMRFEGDWSGFAGVLWSEGFVRSFSNRRQVASYAGWRRRHAERTVAHEQGVSKAGNPPAANNHDTARLVVGTPSAPVDAELVVFITGYSSMVAAYGKVLIVALARKLLIAFWRYVNAGVVMEGAATTAA